MAEYDDRPDWQGLIIEVLSERICRACWGRPRPYRTG